MSSASGASKRRTTVSPSPGRRPTSSLSMTCDDQRTNTCSHAGRTDYKRTFSVVREQAVEDGVAAPALERQVRAHEAFACEPAALGDPLRGDVVGSAGEFQPGDAQRVERPAREQADRAGRDAAAPRCGREPIADPRPPFDEPIQGRAAEDRVGGIDERELDLLAPQPPLLLRGEVVWLPVREALERRDRRRRSHGGLIVSPPRPQPDEVVGQRRRRPRQHQATRESSDSVPVIDCDVAERISTGTISPGEARPSKLTTLLCVVRPRSRDGS